MNHPQPNEKLQQMVAVICEGPQDAAFMNRIFKEMSFTSNETTAISQFASPMNAVLASQLTKVDVEQLNISEAKKNALPLHALKKDHTFLFLYSLGSDSKVVNNQAILNEFLKYKDESNADMQEINDSPPTQFSILYLIDSDQKGKNKRAEELNKGIEQHSTLNKKTALEHKAILHEQNVKLGCYIFSSLHKDTGCLEDLLVPLMKKGNVGPFDDAEKFINTHFDKTRSKKNNYNPQKSLIGVVGQLQKSGSSNVVCINQTDYLDGKIKPDAHCNDIMEYCQCFLKA